MRNSEKPNLAYLKHFRTSTNSHKRSTYNYESEGRRFSSPAPSALSLSGKGPLTHFALVRVFIRG
jgi:hypothetical protein